VRCDADAAHLRDKALGDARIDRQPPWRSFSPMP
jgi:hypothetical protein